MEPWGANVPKAGPKLNHCLQRNGLDARILILSPLGTLGKSLVVEVFHTIKNSMRSTVLLTEN